MYRAAELKILCLLCSTVLCEAVNLSAVKVPLLQDLVVAGGFITPHNMTIHLTCLYRSSAVEEAEVMFESIIRSGQVRAAVRSSSLGPYIDGFVDAAAPVGYTQSSFRDLVVGAAQFARFLPAS